MATGGEVVLVVPDYDYFRMPRDEELEVQELSDGDDSYAVTIKRSSGLLADVVRKVSVYERAARAVGLALRQQIAMKPTKQQIARVPKYGLLRDQALTRLLVFTANTETP